MLIGLFFGLYGEGFDRLWTAHLLKSFTIPDFGTYEPIVFLGIIKAAQLIISNFVLGRLSKKLENLDKNKLPIILIILAIGITISLIGFGYIKILWAAIMFYSLIQIFRNINYPLYTSWFNSNIKDSNIRATMFSVSSQIDSIGQIIGGPITGWVGKIYSIPAAMLLSAILLLPVIPLYLFVNKIDKKNIGKNAA